MHPIRLHPLHFLKYVKYFLLLCLLPVLQAVLDFAFFSAWRTLMQEFAILLACGGILAAMHRASSLSLTDGVLMIRSGVLLRRCNRASTAQVSAVELQRNLLCRLFRASVLTIYFRAGSGLRRIKITLSARQARRLARRLVPDAAAASAFTPVGAERLFFMLLSANVIATAFFSVLSARRIFSLLGEDFRALAIDGITRLEHLLTAFVPAGASLVVTIGLLVFALSLFNSLLRTYRFTAARSGGVLLSRGGLLTHTERRVFVDAITASSLRITPAARLLRRCPVYLSAGCFRGEDLPIFTLSKKSVPQLRQLLPEFCPPDRPLCNPRRKSLPQYLWKPGSLLILVLSLGIVSLRVLPQVSFLLWILALLALGALLCSLEGFFREGFCRNENRTLSVSYCRGFTRYLVSLYTDDLSLLITRFPTAASAGRCDLRIFTPTRRTYHLRGIEFFRARELEFNL